MERETLETTVVRLTIGALGCTAALFDATSLYYALSSGGLIDVARGICAIGLGWMCGWYFTTKFQPTHRLLLQRFLALTGQVVALCAASVAVIGMTLVDWIGADPSSTPFAGIAVVTFVPVASLFATHLSEDRSIHLTSGFGIGMLAYIVLIGLPG